MKLKHKKTGLELILNDTIHGFDHVIFEQLKGIGFEVIKDESELEFIKMKEDVYSFILMLNKIKSLGIVDSITMSSSEYNYIEKACKATNIMGRCINFNSIVKINVIP